ncbi:MAG: periplasmic heavy metal sensor [Candidatus Omnitrophica bacterium]|nr:periplasmic heavy metal sensor [Candidatus Omnitrophota bacterium]
MKKILLGVGMWMLAMLPLAQAQNAPPQPPPNARMERHIQEVFSRLNLTDEQKKELEANKQQHRSVMLEEHRQMKAAREALREELMKPQLDMAKIHRLHDRIKTVVARMEDERLSSILGVRVILTPEQFNKFLNLMDRFHARHLKR